jgi:transposase
MKDIKQHARKRACLTPMALKPQTKIAAGACAPSGESSTAKPDIRLAANRRRHAGADIVPGTLVCLGLDVHVRQITIVRQIDHALPQPAQRMNQEELLAWVQKMTAAGARVVSCYEAGCFGYGLHRRLSALGVENLVVAPEAWSGTAKTDKRDARELCLRRESYASGNRHVFSVVRVPTLEEEARRSAGRQRERLLKERIRAERRGASLLLLGGIKSTKGWWEPGRWAALSAGLSEPLRSEVGLWQEQAAQYQKLQLAAKERLEEQCAADMASLPGGVGLLTWRLLSGEILTWKRFKNRRQVGSYTGLCPGENSSGERRRQGPINRHGNPRVRTLLIEAVWRLTRYETGWHRFAKFPVLLDRGAGSRQRRKAVVAAARLLAIDLWRLETGQTTAERLGFHKDFCPHRRPEAAAG